MGYCLEDTSGRNPGGIHDPGTLLTHVKVSRDTGRGQDKGGGIGLGTGTREVTKFD